MLESWALCKEYTLLRSSAFALAALIIVCLLSRMSMSDSIMGDHGRTQITQTAHRIAADAQMQSIMSRQDTDPIVALFHNIEASAGYKVAKRLCEESGKSSKEQRELYMSSLCDLNEEQDSLLHTLLARLEA